MNAPKLIRRSAWVTADGFQGPHFAGYCVGRDGALSFELGMRAFSAQGIERSKWAREGGLGRLLGYRRGAGAKRAEPGESARKTAAAEGWAAPMPLFDAFQPEREERAAREGYNASRVTKTQREAREDARRYDDAALVARFQDRYGYAPRFGRDNSGINDARMLKELEAEIGSVGTVVAVLLFTAAIGALVAAFVLPVLVHAAEVIAR